MSIINYQFFKFALVGFANTCIAYIVYAACVYVGIHYLLANAIAFGVSVLNAYYWSDRYVFRKGTGETRNAWWTLVKTYLAYGSTGLLLASILLWLYVDRLGISEYLAQVLVLVITIPLNFIINKYWSFKTKRIHEET